jgi:hypothetical protein
MPLASLEAVPSASNKPFGDETEEMKMRTLSLAIGLVFACSTAFAATPKGNGNFRRADAIRAAKANPKSAFVRGLAYMAPKLNKKTSRVLFVENGSTKQVSIVKAPVNKDKPVKVLSTKQANRMGLITQSQAKKLATKNGGVYGTKGSVELKKVGITSGGISYQFNQTAPLGWNIKLYQSQGKQVYGKVKSVYRTVPVTGQQGESAQGYAETIRN